MIVLAPRKWHRSARDRRGAENPRRLKVLTISQRSIGLLLQISCKIFLQEYTRLLLFFVLSTGHKNTNLRLKHN